MTKTDKQILPALHNSGKVKNPDLTELGEKNYTSTILKYSNLALPIPQLETDNKTVVGAINEVNGSIVANPTATPTSSLNRIKIKDTVYSVEGGGGSTVIPNPTETPTDTLNSVEIDNTVYGIDTGTEVVANPTGTPTDTLSSIEIDGSIYGIEGGTANSLAGLTDTDINNLRDRQYLTYDTESAKWKNKGITDLLTNTTKGKYCSFYSPLTADLLGCRVYIEPQLTGNVTPSPNTSAVFSKYPRFAIGYTSSNTHYFSGLYRMYEHEDCTWYAKLGTLNWYYEDGVFKTQGYFFNFPRYHFGCINSLEYSYKGDISNSGSADKSIGYWDTAGENPQSYLWIRDDQYSGDVSAFTSAVYDDYVIYHSVSPSNFPGDSTYTMLVAAFRYQGWVRKFDWTSIPQFPDGIFGGEWNVVSKQLYNTWADKNITTSDQCIKDDVYVTYRADDWARLPKELGSGGQALCTNFVFEPETLYPEADHFSIYGNQIIFNVSTIGNIWDWTDWLEEHPNFTVLYEASDAPYANLSYETIPQVNAGVTQLWASSEGTVEATYYSGDATPYIDFTKLVIKNTTIDYGDLDNKPKINDHTLVGNNSTSDLGLDDYEDLTNMPQINGHTLIGNKTGDDLDLGGGGGGGGDISVKNFTTNNVNTSTLYAKYFEIGPLVFVDCVFSITGSISSGTAMFSGLPVAAYQTYLAGASNNSSLNRFYTEDGYIYSAMTFSSNARTYHISGSYLKASS